MQIEGIFFNSEGENESGRRDLLNVKDIVVKLRVLICDWIFPPFFFVLFRIFLSRLYRHLDKISTPRWSDNISAVSLWQN